MTLSTPILWIGLPLLVALIAGIAFNRKPFGIILTSATAFGLALLALTFPENMALSLGPLNLVFKESSGDPGPANYHQL